MYDVNGIYAFISVVLFVVLLCKVDNRFGKTDRELNEIKKKMDALLKAQKENVREPAKVEGRAAMPASASPVTEKPVVKEPVPKEPVTEKPVVKEPMAEKPAVKESVVEKPLLKEPVAEKPMREPVAIEKEPAEQPAPRLRVAPVVPMKKNINYEKFIGENLFGKIGILVFVIGVGFFVKYAIDKDWINETMRTVLGFLTGSVLLAIAQRLQNKYRTFSSLLAGGAFAVFYLTVAIAFHYYHLFSQTMAFVILVGVTVFMSALSVLYDRRELAVTALVGGFLAPFIVSSGAGNYIVLFTYLSVLNVGMFGLSTYKKWGELPVISFAFTYLVMGLYVVSSYLGGVPTETVACHLLIFATLFYFIFLLPVLSILRLEGKSMSRILLSVIVLNNFIYLGLGVLFLQDMNLPFKATGLLSLFIAIVNLGLVAWLRKSKQDYKFLIYSMLGLVLTFVSITVPIQLNGHYITLFWASEMVLLLWLYVKSKIRVYEYASFVLVCLTFMSFVLDVFYWTNGAPSETIFLNSSFVTSLYMGLATGAFALLMGHHRSFFSTARLLAYTHWNAFMLLASVVILYYTFMSEFYLHLDGATAGGAMLLFTSAAIFTVSCAFEKRFPMVKYATFYKLGMAVGVLVFAIAVCVSYNHYIALGAALLRWLAGGFVAANLYAVSRRYITTIGLKPGYLVYLNVLSTLLLLALVRFFLLEIGVKEFSAGFSSTLSVVGLIQMCLGMRLHQKVLRIISLVTFGIVLFKLGLVDLWAMPALGKIIVFILLGVILLVLSFLYQKLKNVLFNDDKDEEV